MPVLTVINQKGGVGKTTTTLNLAAALRERGRTVLIVDFDPQASLTTCCGLNGSDPFRPHLTIADALLTTVGAPTDRAAMLRDVIVTTVDAIQLAPSSQDLAAAEATLHTTFRREYALRETLAQVEHEFDVILVDGVPTAGLLAANSLVAADGLIIPVQAEFLAVHGLSQLMNDVALIRQRLNPSLDLWGIVLTMVDLRTKHARDTIARVKDQFSGQIPLFQTQIPVDVRLRESTKAAATILAFAPTSRASHAYRQLAREVESRLAELPGTSAESHTGNTSSMLTMGGPIIPVTECWNQAETGAVSSRQQEPGCRGLAVNPANGYGWLRRDDLRDSDHPGDDPLERQGDRSSAATGTRVRAERHGGVRRRQAPVDDMIPPLLRRFLEANEGDDEHRDVTTVPLTENADDDVTMRRTEGKRDMIACPYLGLEDDTDRHWSGPSSEHRCLAIRPPPRLNVWQQSTYCLGEDHRACAHFPRMTARSSSDDDAPGLSFFARGYHPLTRQQFHRLSADVPVGTTVGRPARA